MTATWAGVPIDTALLADYGYRDTIVFAGENWPRYLGYLAAGLAQQASDLGLANNGFTSTSATSVAIGLGAKSLVVGISLGLRAGMIVQVSATADPTQWMNGTVTAYDPATGALTFTSTAASGDGTSAAWTVALAGSASNTVLVSSSATSVAIGLGAKTFVVGVSLGLRAGMMMQAVATADTAQWMSGTVTSYDSVSGALVLSVTVTGGAGTYAAWTIAPIGVQGVQGIQGDQGVQGIQGPGGSGVTIAAQQDGAPVTVLARGNIDTRASIVSVDDAAGNRIGISLKNDSASPGALRVYGTDGAGTKGWQTASLMSRSYANRGDLRAIELSTYVIVESIGLLGWTSGSTEIDDDETCFATATGAWTLVAADPDYVFASWIAEFDAADSKFLRAWFPMTVTTLGATISASFTVTVQGAAVGDSVAVTPGDAFGTNPSDQGRLSFAAYISAPNTVIVSIRNSSAASTVALTASVWSVLVVKQ